MPSRTESGSGEDMLMPGSSLAEDLPEEDKIDEHSAGDRVEDPLKPEQPTPLRAQRGNNTNGQQDESCAELFLIALESCQSDTLCALGEVAEVGDAGEGGKDSEEPAGDPAPSAQLQSCRSEQDGNDEECEQNTHEKPVARLRQSV